MTGPPFSDEEAGDGPVPTRGKLIIFIYQAQYDIFSSLCKSLFSGELNKKTIGKLNM